ncbi:calmodulin-binding protein 25-like [Senna tora]|uniref:Calmodulin-binding protein 25-like n=1 Tax=Senna tora TaxID=362788 RepID=A0A834TDQ2_9FABA|nr:calmodulin-binding protein 25-like [Senna tora]
MASSENLASIEHWTFRPTFQDSWFTDVFARETETLTKALQKSLSGSNSETLTSDTISPFLNHLIQPDTTPTPTVSGLSGSDQEAAPAKQRQRSAIPPAAGGKISKRKSRASKRSQTTFITADPANFRQMVQQVTGVRLGNSQMPMAPILKPEPQRPGSRLPVVVGGGCLPTLDTSAFLLDHQHQMMGPATASGPGLSGPGPLPFPPSAGVVDAAGIGSAGLDFDTFPSFPTLESWKVM